MLGLNLALTSVSVLALRAGVPAVPEKVVFAGDSFTAAANSWAERAMAKPGLSGVDWSKIAVGGRQLGTSANLNDGGNTLWGHAADIIAASPSVVVILIGPNDALGSGDGSAYAAAVMDFGDYLKSLRSGLKVVIVTNAPRADGTSGANASFNAKRLVAEAAWRAAVGSRIAAVVPIASHPLMIDAAASDGVLIQGGADRLHPTDAGQQLIGDVTAVVVAAVLSGTAATSPGAIAFTDVTGADPSTAIVGGHVLLAGMSPTASVVIAADNGGSASIGQGAFSANPGSARLGDAIRPRRTSSAAALGEVSTTISAGSTTALFRVTTKAANPASIGNAGVTAPLTFTGGSPQTSAAYAWPGGRPAFFVTSLSTANPTIEILDADDGDKVIATCTNCSGYLNNSNYRQGFARAAGDLPAGNHKVRVSSPYIDPSTKVFVLRIANSNGGPDTGGAGNGEGYHNGGVMAASGPVTVASAGIGVTMAYGTGITNLGGHTLVYQYAGSWGLYAFATTQTPQLTINDGPAGLQSVGLQ